MTSTGLVGLPAESERDAWQRVGSVAADDARPCVMVWPSRVGRLRPAMLTEGSPSRARP